MFLLPHECVYAKFQTVSNKSWRSHIEDTSFAAGKFLSTQLFYSFMARGFFLPESSDDVAAITVISHIACLVIRHHLTAISLL